ncbi:hypothetical protein Sme01_65580 [Sphaerisporangium melleum]|uniref:Uncharacterized protein n=1 Tax=Sphaerisporangium melleum TaxID=321316 RepID=A0A917RET9_9ACTN|nr:hypothetical protein GCM10007964_53700 [Sphaerisporangium melleum]GII74082.1 hypothetical protein Sme01_65580 [Sphaerisporangium melleum]
MTVTVPLSLFGTYTRDGNPATAGLSIPARSLAYTSRTAAFFAAPRSGPASACGDRPAFAAAVGDTVAAGVAPAPVRAPSPPQPEVTVTSPSATPAATSRRPAARHTLRRRRPGCPVPASPVPGPSA